jgi:hypothetical protein
VSDTLVIDDRGRSGSPASGGKRASPRHVDVLEGAFFRRMLSLAARVAMVFHD